VFGRADKSFEYPQLIKPKTTK